MTSQHWRVYVVVNGVAEVAGFHATFESAEKDAAWLQEHGYKVEIAHLQEITKMLTLEELTDHRDAISNLNNRARVTDDESQALEIVNQMLSALIYQLENQSVSFTP